jgi:cathepsin B
MKSLLILSFLLTFTVAFICAYPTPAHKLRDMQSRVSWKVGENKHFHGKTIEQAKRLLGWNPKLEKKFPPKHYPKDGLVDLPTNFNASSKWPNCPTISTIYNQADCGSCWAFGGVSAASDRACISSGGKFTQTLSFADVVECDSYSDGCEGGSAGSTWDFIGSPGIVTDSCYPYYIPTCPPSQQPCLNFVDTPNCWSNNSCVDNTNWNNDIHTATNVYSLDSVEDAQQDIYTNGPIEACFSVYEDFLSYKSGVYIYDGTSPFLGGHCIRMVGWGVESGTPYWLITNSWTSYWGDNGYVKIERGVDMCGIEDDMIAGTMS